jgi:TPR repeat protein
MRGIGDCLLCIGLLASGSTVPVVGGFDEGMAAYEAGDFATALAEWQPLAEQGSAAAQFNLGLLHYHGKGVAENRAEAARWFLRAAEGGFVRAQYRVAGIYEEGDGMEQDLARALMWFTIAGKSRYRDARKQRKRLARTMPPTEISYAEMYVRQWNRDRKQQPKRD